MPIQILSCKTSVWGFRWVAGLKYIYHDVLCDTGSEDSILKEKYKQI